MNSLQSIPDLQNYAQDIRNQLEALKLSTVFSPIEKIELQGIYNQLLQVTEKRLSDLQNLIDSAQWSQ